MTNTKDSGNSSLRHGLEYAETHARTTINFNIPGPGPHTIALTSPLPTIIANEVIVDGTSQPGYSGTPLIVLDGTNVPSGEYSNGLTVTASKCAVKGLAIHSFQGAGISLEESSGFNNTVQACVLGSNAPGLDLGNRYGVTVRFHSHHNTIGGTTPEARNVISGNQYDGVQIQGIGFDINGTVYYEDGNIIQGNFIGTDPTGIVAVPNRGNGIDIGWGAINTLIGGTTPGAGNLISGNGGIGVQISQVDTLDDVIDQNNKVQGNLIGTDVTGTKAIPNFHGVHLVFNARGNLIGGTTPAARNVISGNQNLGIYITGAGRNTIYGNYIGPDISGAAGIGTQTYGIRALYDARRLLIGGEESGAGNLIAFNSEAGVGLWDASAQGITIRGNSIFNNGRIGIDLELPSEKAPYITPNDTGDADTDGPNHLQNYPILKTVAVNSGNLVISGNLHSTPISDYVLDFYRSSRAGLISPGEGQAQTYLGRALARTDALGNISFSATLPFKGSGTFFTATATEVGSGSTSELSRPLTAIVGGKVSGRCISMRADSTFSAVQRLGVGNVTVTLLKSNGQTAAQVQSDVNGNYAFPALAPGNYTMTATAKREDQSLVVMDPPTRAVTVQSADIAVPRFALYSIFGVVKKPGSSGTNVPVANTTVQLYNPNGVLVGSRVTGADGRFEFRNQRAAAFTVKASAAGLTFIDRPTPVPSSGQPWSPCTRANLVGQPTPVTAPSGNRF